MITIILLWDHNMFRILFFVFAVRVLGFFGDACVQWIIRIGPRSPSYYSLAALDDLLCCIKSVCS